ncbi:MAG TPA: mersacidin/lichenicidin family type 2 lantibiotic [Ktedonosporobacter sp.]|nr:mersacidin/lichenicidin family type 2 lantibiotic [Ktedonosporobacter sp.]
MSTEGIIHAWKHGPQVGKKPVKALHSSEEPEKEPADAPANPAGEQELNEEELELVEGGTQGSTLYCTKGHCPDTQ